MLTIWEKAKINNGRKFEFMSSLSFYYSTKIKIAYKELDMIFFNM